MTERPARRYISFPLPICYYSAFFSKPKRKAFEKDFSILPLCVAAASLLLRIPVLGRNTSVVVLRGKKEERSQVRLYMVFQSKCGKSAKNSVIERRVCVSVCDLSSGKQVAGLQRDFSLD